ncbi:MAG TPA: hypothetical protein EYG03_19905 [Planctomycetes bacterium]|nr:hypothetical protein [Planctomycetota bacterium]
MCFDQPFGGKQISVIAGIRLASARINNYTRDANSGCSSTVCAKERRFVRKYCLRRYKEVRSG